MGCPHKIWKPNMGVCPYGPIGYTYWPAGYTKPWQDNLGHVFKPDLLNVIILSLKDQPILRPQSENVTKKDMNDMFYLTDDLTLGADPWYGKFIQHRELAEHNSL